MQNTIGLRLRERRTSLRLSMRMVAATIGAASHSTVRDYETGRRRVPAEVLPLLARIYHCRVRDFYKPTGAPWSHRTAAKRPVQLRFTGLH